MEHIKFAQVDWSIFVSSFDDGFFDMAFVDFPSSSPERHLKTGTTTRCANRPPSLPIEGLEKVMQEMYRVLAPKSHCYVVLGDPVDLKPGIEYVEAAGFEIGNYLVWDQMYKSNGYRYRRSKDIIIFAMKGKRALNNRSLRDVFTVPNSPVYGYLGEKPLALVEPILLNSTNVGEKVLDPFMGAGSLAEACYLNGRKFFGCDINEEAIEHTKDRLQRRRNAFEMLTDVPVTESGKRRAELEDDDPAGNAGDNVY